MLPNGNFVVSDPGYDAPGPILDAGAVYLYNGTTLEVISVLSGSSSNDRVGGGGISVLPSGNYVVESHNWNEGRGAATWGNGTVGVSGLVSASNSLVGETSDDFVGDIVVVLSNGNYVVGSPFWNRRRGAATWASGTAGVSGLVSSSNSLTGNNEEDRVGNEIVKLPNGNYVVCSPDWNWSRGAVTWGNGTEGVSGPVSPSNSLMGDTANDFVGSALTVLPSGNYLVGSLKWNGSRGAVTWGSGLAGVSGLVSSSNSVVGDTANDSVGSAIIVLPSGNYLLQSRYWNAERGAVTWGSASVGVAGVVGPSNSLVGSVADDSVGVEVTVLPSGNYVVLSKFWNESRGAVTWGNGMEGVSGAVSPANSLVGSTASEHVGISGVWVLSNGNYVVGSPYWNQRRGAATWGSGVGGVRGTVSSSNSLVGNTANAHVVDRGVAALSNGNYVVCSSWNEGRGAVTWGDGTVGKTGVVSSSNSLVGSTDDDLVGGNRWGMGNGIYVLPNGNFVVLSSGWNGNRGAVTWGNGTTGISGSVSASNSLVGTTANDFLSGDVSVLSNGNYVVANPYWNGIRGAATWGSGTEGVTGAISASNSLVGSSELDGVSGRIFALSNGNYVVQSGGWNGSLGAATWGSGTAGVKGTVSSSNSLVGSTEFDSVGGAIHVLANGNYIVRSLGWNEARGAVTWGSGTVGISGPVSSSNSLVGSTADDQLGAYDLTELSNGNYIVQSFKWNGLRGAVTWGSGTVGISGPVSSSNSLVGSTAEDYVGVIVALANGDYAVSSLGWDNGPVYNAGAVTLVDGGAGIAGSVAATNSFLGTAANGGDTMTLTYDPANSRVLVGYPAANRVVLIGNAPEMSVIGNAATIADGDTVPAEGNRTDFGRALAGGGHVLRTFTIANSGMEPLVLSGSPAVSVSGPHAAEFAVTTAPSATVNSAASTTFEITFTPGGIGLRTATLSISNNDRDESLYTFAIQGTGQTAIENWRTLHFGNAAENTGNLDDFDSDGIENLLEFAFGTLPNDRFSGASELRYMESAPGSGIVITTGKPIMRLENFPDENGFSVIFVRRKDHSEAGLIYDPQFSANLGAWQSSPSAPIILADDGTHQIVQVSAPLYIEGKQTRFFRISVGIISQ